mmetsp:Transcript_43949/g.116220  ORF Transcript_43949/g.116220 Transcript_43949/m.116220 type:complete len:260 (-) Transcript_43949:63-842(-)
MTLQICISLHHPGEVDDDDRQDVEGDDDVRGIDSPSVRPCGHERDFLVVEQSVHNVHRGPEANVHFDVRELVDEEREHGAPCHTVVLPRPPQVLEVQCPTSDLVDALLAHLQQLAVLLRRKHAAAEHLHPGLNVSSRLSAIDRLRDVQLELLCRLEPLLLKENDVEGLRVLPVQEYHHLREAHIVLAGARRVILRRETHTARAPEVPDPDDVDGKQSFITIRVVGRRRELNDVEGFFILRRFRDLERHCAAAGALSRGS